MNSVRDFAYRLWKQYGFRAARLVGYVHVLDEGSLPPDAGSEATPSDLQPVVTRIADERLQSLSGDDLARLQAGCLLAALRTDDGQALARAWVRLGRQYPSVLDTAVWLAPDTAYLFDAFVHAGVRRRGLGRQAIALGEQAARASGAMATFSWIERTNHASRRLMTSMGYEPVVDAIRVTRGRRIRFWCTSIAPSAMPYLRKATRGAQ